MAKVRWATDISRRSTAGGDTPRGDMLWVEPLSPVVRIDLRIGKIKIPEKPAPKEHPVWILLLR
uniref:Uncharacterized protein n=1 Tax=Candidatus Kentrum sp. LPFa TaxID=2126335 RepID=A0A450WHI3_9GAMM|nr:MAG: hypothetical protein BECKLPF1236B_GA0070989_109610 [Candidatus Kentron sp. LPFa]